MPGAPPPGATVFLGASLAIAVLGGVAYSFPIYILDLKKVLSLTETMTNVLGVMVYATSSAVAIPLAPLLIHRHLRLLQVLSGLLAPLGYFLLYAVSRLWVEGQAALAVACVGIVALMLSVGFLFPYTVGRCMQKFGPTSVTWVSALLNFGFAVGGLIASLIYYYLQPSLKGFLLGATITHAGGTTLCLCILAWMHEGVFDPTGGKPGSPNSGPAAAAEPLLGINAEAQGPGKLAAGDDDPLLGSAKALSPQPEAPPDEAAPFSVVLKKVARSADYYLVCLVMFLKVGIGGAFTTNIGAIMETKGATSLDVAKAVVFLVRKGANRLRTCSNLRRCWPHPCSLP